MAAGAALTAGFAPADPVDGIVAASASARRRGLSPPSPGAALILVKRLPAQAAVLSGGCALDKISRVAAALGVPEEWFFNHRPGSGPLERAYVVRETNRRNLNLLYGEPVEQSGYSDQLLSSSIGGSFYLGVSVYHPHSEQVIDQYGARLVGRAQEVRERFYVISVERRLRHPAVLAIQEGARERLFADPPGSEPGP